MKTKWSQRLSLALSAMLLSLCVLPLSSALAALDPTSTSTSASINRSGVNFRTGPSTSYAKIGTLSLNTQVTVLGSSGSWYNITVNSTGKTGYVYSSYVTLSGSAAPAADPTNITGYINRTSVNFRTGPSTSYSKLGTLYRNTAVTITGSSGDWYRITVNSSGTSGYVYASFVTQGSGGPDVASGNGYINTSGVNFRTGPSTSYSKIGTLSKNTAVTVTGFSGNWTQITVVSTGRSGYVYYHFVTQTGSTYSTGSVNVSGAQLYAGPATGYTVVATLAYGERVTITSSADGWYRVTVNSSGASGYIYASYISFDAYSGSPDSTGTVPSGVIDPTL